MKAIRKESELRELRKSLEAKRDSARLCISVSDGTCCRASGSVMVIKSFEDEVSKKGLKGKVDVKSVGCLGFCENEPIAVISPQEIFYVKVKPGDAAEIISETILKNNILEHLLYTDPATEKKIEHEGEVPFYKRQRREVLGQNKLIDPTDIMDYVRLGGYEALAKAVARMTPESVIAEIKKSGLRGRGGAGFPTGFKWEFCRRAKGDTKHIICNADEGDPGAYMDRSVLEGNPHSIIEGMVIGAYAIGAQRGFVYVRNEYPLAVSNLRVALKQARDCGFLGKNILGSGFDFEVAMERGAGAFVCGEETALIASIEGKKGEPRQRPPFPAIKGLWGKPTNINNVETWANVPLIINRGADWYSRIGTEKSKGTKIFSLVGKVNNTGLVEVPMGTSLREIIDGIGGGIRGDGEFKAVQTGGPSGGCIPRHLLDIPIEYESLAEVGSIMGSGGMIVMDDSTCMVDVAKYFLNFLREESCGKCLSCREGIQRMWEIVSKICEGKGKEEDLELLGELAVVVKDSSMCGLGQTASNPVLSTLRYFRKEYESHIREKRCPAGVCKALIKYMIDEEKCVGCMLCLKKCPQKAITGELKKTHRIDPEKCIRCGICMEVCKPKAVFVV